MTTKTSERPRYVPGGGEAWRNPWPAYAALRDHDPVHHVVPERAPDLDYFVLTRHADVMAAAVDAATFSSAAGLTVHYDELDRIGLADNPPMVMQDPPDHTTFRRLVSRGFTPRAVVSVEPAVRGSCASGWPASPNEARATSSPSCSSRCRAWSWRTTSACRRRTAAASTGGPTRSSRRARPATWPALPRRSPRCSGTSASWSSDAAATPATTRSRTSWPPASATTTGGLLSILAYVFTMVTGGNDTTTGMLGGAVQLLTERPDQRRALVDDPEP